MSNEIKATYLGPATANLRGLVFNAAGQVYNTATPAFEAYNAANVAHYGAIALSQVGATPEYLGDVPAALPAGRYRVSVYLTATGTPQTADLTAANWQSAGEVEWKGPGELSLAADTNATAAATNAQTGATSQQANVEAALTAQGYTGGLAGSLGALPTAAEVATAVWGAGTRSLTDKGGYALSAAEETAIANALLDQADAIENGESLREALRLMRAVLAGDSTVSGSSVTFKRKDGTTGALTIGFDPTGNRSGSTDGTLT